MFLGFVGKWFTCYYFTNLLEVPLGACTRACFYPRLTCRSDGLHIYLALVSAELLRVGWRGDFSTHISTDESITVGYMTSLVLFIFKRCVYKTLAFWKNLKESAKLLNVTLSIFDVFVQRFLMEAPKLSDHFLSLSLSVRAADIFLLPNIIDGLRSCNWVVDNLTACLVGLLWYLFCPSVPCDDRVSKVIG